MSKLIGTDPNQVPTNADLGTLAYQNAEFPTVKNLKATGSLILGDESTISGGSGLGRTLTVPEGSSGDLFLFGPSPEIGFLDSNADRSSAIDGNDGHIHFYSNVGTASDSLDTVIDGTSKATASPALRTVTINRINRDTTANGGGYLSGGDINVILGDYQIGGTSVIDSNRRGTFGSVGTTAAASALRVGMDDGNFANSTPTMQIYHYNYPDDNTTNVPSLDIRVGNSDADMKHHGSVQLRQIFTGSARQSPELQFHTNANGSNDKGIIRLYAAGGSTPSFNIHSDLIGSSESNVDIVNNSIFYVASTGAEFLSDVAGNEPSQRGALRIRHAGGETATGGLEFHTSSAGGAGYGARITADTSGRMYVQTRSNSSSWTTQQTFDASGFGSEIEGYDFTSGTTNLAPPLRSDLWSSITFNGASQTYTQTTFNNRTVNVIRLQNTDSSHWNFFRYDGYANQDNDQGVPGSENYAVFEFWSKNNGGSNTAYRGFIAEGDVWQGSPSRTSSTSVIYTNADGWSLNRTVMLMLDGYKLNFGFGFDYNRQGADMYFAFPSFYFASGKRGSMQSGIPLAMDGNNGLLQIGKRHLQVARGGQVSGSVAGRHFELNNNNWVTFGYLYQAQSTPLLIRALAGHNSYGTYDDFINDTYAYNISDGTTVTIGSTSTGSAYSAQIRKVKRTNIVDSRGRRVVNTGDGGWEYQIARNQAYGMRVYLQISGVHGNQWTWQLGDDAA